MRENLRELPGPWPWGLALVLAACGAHETGDSGDPGAPGDRPPGAASEASGFPTAPYTIRGRWDPPEIRYSVATEGPLGARLREAVVEAAAAWSQAGSVRFTPAEDGADVHFSFASGSHGSCAPFGSGAGVAHTGPVQPGTFVHFDADTDWSAPGSLELSALHEVGHLLGLGHTEAPASLMHPDPTLGAAIGEHEQAALASLYGGELPAGNGDLLVRDAAGSERALLWRAAPGPSALVVFDTDGDGRDEVVLWRTDPAGQGLLVTYAFDDRMRPTHTVGPMLGAVVPGAPVELGVTTGGARAFACARPGFPDVVRAFDERGRIAAPRAEDNAGVEWRDRATATGDLDGDGSLETVFRRE